MRDLHLLGVHEDGEHLVLGDGERQYRLALDDTLRAAVRWERRHHVEQVGATEEPLRPRDVQAMIRAGATTEEAAERAGWTVEKVRKYETPILAERSHMASEAGRAHVRTRPGSHPVTLADRVAARLSERGVNVEDAEWDSWRSEDGQWSVEVRFGAGGRARTASWLFTRSTMTVLAADDEARWLSDDEHQEAPPVTHMMSPTLSPTDRGTVYDVEAEGGLADAPVRGVRPSAAETRHAGDRHAGTRHAGDREDDALASAVRERSAASRRRRPTKRATSPSALPDRIGSVEAEDALPLADLTYDPEIMPPPPGAHSDPDPDGLDGRPEPDAVTSPVRESSTAPVESAATSMTEPTPEPTPEPRPEPTARSEHQPTATPQPTLTSEPAAESEHQPEPAATTASEPERVVTPEPEPAAPQAPKPTPTTSPSPRAKPTPQGRQPGAAKRKSRASVPAWEDIMFGQRPGGDSDD